MCGLGGECLDANGNPVLVTTSGKNGVKVSINKKCAGQEGEDLMGNVDFGDLDENSDSSVLASLTNELGVVGSLEKRTEKVQELVYKARAKFLDYRDKMSSVEMVEKNMSEVAKEAQQEAKKDNDEGSELIKEAQAETKIADSVKKQDPG